VPRLVLPGLDEIGFGAYEGGPLVDYRAWAWTNEPDVPCPGGGESRAHVAERLAGALDELLARPEEMIVAVSHALPVRYVIDASDGTFPAARIAQVPHTTPFRLDADAVELAAETLRVWATAPRFVDLID
jgi:broad specificity phosphatase PhoE